MSIVILSMVAKDLTTCIWPSTQLIISDMRCGEVWVRVSFHGRKLTTMVWCACRSTDNDVRNLSQDIYGLLANNPDAKLALQRHLRAHVDGDWFVGWVDICCSIHVSEVDDRAKGKSSKALSICWCRSFGTIFNPKLGVVTAQRAEAVAKSWQLSHKKDDKIVFFYQ